MVLATRCPNCGTSFRVVPDQLKLRGGWVRCGVCSKTFDSNTSLAEVALPVETASVAPVVPVVAEPAIAHHAPEVVDPILDHPAVLRMRGARPAVTQDPDPLPAAAPEVEPYSDLNLHPASELNDAFVAPLRADTRDGVSFEGAESAAPFHADRKLVFGSEPQSEFLADPVPLQADTRNDREPRFDDHSVVQGTGVREPGMVEPTFVADKTGDRFSAASAHPLPGFLDDAADKQPSRLRWVWIVGAVLALLVLLGQAVMLYRTDIATRFPILRPVLERVCASFACTVGYPRDLRQLSIESSSLESWDAPVAATPAPAVPEPGVAPSAPDAGAATDIAPAASAATPPVRRLALTVVLRNRAKFAQPWPSFELSLTDFSETVVARRVLLPSAYLAPQQLSEPLPAGAEVSLRIPIETSDAKASGYRVAVFFP